MNRKRKIQYLLTKHILEEGYIDLMLPDGLVVELGILQEGEDGILHKTQDYSWVMASQKNRIISMDSYNCGLQCEDRDDNMLVETCIDSENTKNRIVSMV
jgi:hypothetical protein